MTFSTRLYTSRAPSTHRSTAPHRCFPSLHFGLHAGPPLDSPSASDGATKGGVTTALFVIESVVFVKRNIQQTLDPRPHPKMSLHPPDQGSPVVRRQKCTKSGRETQTHRHQNQSNRLVHVLTHAASWYRTTPKLVSASPMINPAATGTTTSPIQRSPFDRPTTGWPHNRCRRSR